jgi:septal ring factor EnvC (AmiA/AmiB activator)
MKKKKTSNIDLISQKMTYSIGTNTSILVHTILFIGIFSLKLLGLTVDQILLILTTAVSLEAIYLAIFIQMTVNRTTQSLAGVEEDIDDLQENVGDIQEDVDSLESNIKEISEDYIDYEEGEDEVVNALKDIEKRLKDLQGDIVVLKKKGLF